MHGSQVPLPRRGLCSDDHAIVVLCHVQATPHVLAPTERDRLQGKVQQQGHLQQGQLQHMIFIMPITWDMYAFML